jgi:hypothetical protein
MSRIVQHTGRLARFGINVGFAVVSLASGSALAAPGDHIRAGVVEIIPRVDLGLVYHSNIYRSEEDPASAVNFALSPGVAASASGDDHSFSMDGSWTLQKYLFVGGADPALEDNAARIANLDRFDAFSVGAGTDLFKRSVVGLELSDDLVRRNWTIDSENADVPYTSQLRNAFLGTLRTNPAPALELSPALAWTYDSYQAPILQEGDSRSLNDRNAIGPRLDVKWAFLPRTAIVGHVDYSNNSWSSNVVTSQIGGGSAGEIAIPNSNFVKGSVGIDGRFTERVFAQAFIGYGVGLFSESSVVGAVGPVLDNVSGLDGLLAKVQIKYAIVPSSPDAPGSSVTAGYVKDFRTSFFTNYVAMNQLFAEFRGRFDDFEPSLRYEARFEGYSGAVDRNDLVNVVRGAIGYVPANYVNINANVGFLSRGSTVDAIDYSDLQLGLGATFLY